MRTDGKTNKEIYDVVTIRVAKGTMTDKLKRMALYERTKYDRRTTVNSLGERALAAFITAWERDNGLTEMKAKLNTNA